MEKKLEIITSDGHYYHIYLGKKYIFCSKNRKEILKRISGFMYFLAGEQT